MRLDIVISRLLTQRRTNTSMPTTFTNSSYFYSIRQCESSGVQIISISMNTSLGRIFSSQTNNITSMRMRSKHIRFVKCTQRKRKFFRDFFFSFCKDIFFVQIMIYFMAFIELHDFSVRLCAIELCKTHDLQPK